MGWSMVWLGVDMDRQQMAGAFAILHSRQFPALVYTDNVQPVVCSFYYFVDSMSLLMYSCYGDISQAVLIAVHDPSRSWCIVWIQYVWLYILWLANSVLSAVVCIVVGLQCLLLGWTAMTSSQQVNGAVYFVVKHILLWRMSGVPI